jgi:RNA polymerase sigma-70 factor (ECF subfamily)
MLIQNDFEEKELLEKLRQNDKDAYLKLYSHYHGPIYHFITRFVKSPFYAEDILQDVFLKMWEIRSRVNPELSFKAYLYRISRNLVYKFLKKAAADEAILAHTMHFFKAATDDIEITLQWKEYEQKIEEAIAQLPPKRQMVFRLCREENKSYDAVSNELGISRNTVKEHMVLAMKNITEYLKLHSGIELPLLVLLLFGK